VIRDGAALWFVFWLLIGEAQLGRHLGDRDLARLQGQLQLLDTLRRRPKPVIAMARQLMPQLLDQDSLRLHLDQQKSRELPEFIGVFRQGFVDVQHGQNIAKQRRGGNPACVILADLSCLERCPTALRQPPIDPFQQHRQLGCRQRDFAVLGRGPHEPTLLKAFAEQTSALAIPPNDFYQIATPTTEDKQMPREGILLQRLFGLSRQRRKTTPHVGHTRSQPDARVRRDRDHAERPRIRRANASGS